MDEVSKLDNEGETPIIEKKQYVFARLSLFVAYSLALARPLPLTGPLAACDSRSPLTRVMSPLTSSCDSLIFTQSSQQLRRTVRRRNQVDTLQISSSGPRCLRHHSAPSDPSPFLSLLTHPCAGSRLLQPRCNACQGSSGDTPQLQDSGAVRKFSSLRAFLEWRAEKERYANRDSPLDWPFTVRGQVRAPPLLATPSSSSSIQPRACCMPQIAAFDPSQDGVGQWGSAGVVPEIAPDANVSNQVLLTPPSPPLPSPPPLPCRSPQHKRSPFLLHSSSPLLSSSAS